MRWKAEDLAKRSTIGVATIRRFELQDGIPVGNTTTLGVLKRTLEEADIELIGTPEDAPGVRLHNKPKPQ